MTSHLSLPRKWRPRQFGALVGQESVARTLSRAIEEGRVAPAYLFTGPRGVGKTTTARLLAMCLNCEKGPTLKPCGTCPSCREISERGESLDTMEVDAASNRGVDNARELLEILRYQPQRDRYRILILDEVHMLTKEAFNALLKTLEEPPPYGIFILASTELHKIPATIVSRCQRFSFRRLTPEEIARRLSEVAAAEHIAVTEGALAAIARAGDGSLRDALSLLDQAATLGSASVDEALCAQVFALVERGVLADLCAAVLSGDRARLLDLLARAREEGLDPRHGAEELLEFQREVLLACIRGGSPDARVKELAAAAPYESHLRALSLSLETVRSLGRAGDAWLAWELSLLKMAELPRLRAVEEALAGAAPAPALPPRPAVPPPASPAAGPGGGESAVARFVGEIQQRRVRFGTYLSRARRIERRGAELWIAFGPSEAAARDSLDRPEAREALAGAARTAFGEPLAIRLEVEEGPAAPPQAPLPPPPAPPAPAGGGAAGDPLVQSALSLFRGELVEIKEKP